MEISMEKLTEARKKNFAFQWNQNKKKNFIILLLSLVCLILLVVVIVLVTGKNKDYGQGTLIKYFNSL